MRKIFLLIMMMGLFISISAFDYEKLLTSNDVMGYQINVVGAVNNPGIYLLSPSTRISMAIKLANTIEDTLNTPSQISHNRSLRTVVLKRDDTEISFDLRKYLVNGDLSQNPYIQDGDVIIVSTVKNRIYLYGAVGLENNKLQESYELLEGEKISDIIQLAYGLENGVDSNNCEVVRFDAESGEIKSIKFSASDIMKNPSLEDNIILQNDDRIYIRKMPNYHHKRYISIEGEVKYPGEYAIELGKTTLLEVLKKCGGPTEQADLKKSYLFRISTEDTTRAEYNNLRKTPAFDQSTAEYRYYCQMVTENRNIITENFEAIYSQKNDVILKDKDRIFIVAKSSVVSVNGEVNTPGLFSFEAGKDYQYYIEQAGGAIKRANESKIRIIRGDSGEWIKPNKKTKIYAGDTIYVPRHERFSYYWPYIKETVAFVSGLATSIVVMKGLMSN